jgi:hypothetical protein
VSNLTCCVRTGKSFIGALLAKAIHDLADERILVVCYTNHALDQFLEDLLDIGIPQSSIVRLGGKSTTRTDPLSLQNLQRGPNQFKFTRADWATIDSIREELRTSDSALKTLSTRFANTDLGLPAIMEFLEFEEPDYYEAFSVPTSMDGMQLIGRKNKAIGPYELIGRWIQGQDAGLLKNAPSVLQFDHIWSMPLPERKNKLLAWKNELLREQVIEINKEAVRYNSFVRNLERKFDEGRGAIIRSKQIVGCTTTAAAMYREHLNAAAPDVLLVEEAGEILESHVLTALAQKTKQLILIGDHKYGLLLFT